MKLSPRDLFILKCCGTWWQGASTQHGFFVLSGKNKNIGVYIKGTTLRTAKPRADLKRRQQGCWIQSGSSWSDKATRSEVSHQAKPSPPAAACSRARLAAAGWSSRDGRLVPVLLPRTDPSPHLQEHLGLISNRVRQRIHHSAVRLFPWLITSFVNDLLTTS